MASVNNAPSFKRIETVIPTTGIRVIGEAYRGVDEAIYIAAEVRNEHGTLIGKCPPIPADALSDLVLDLWDQADEEIF